MSVPARVPGQGGAESCGSDADYAAIEAAVMETARGRWFLAEHARRNRHAETEGVLAALARLEAQMRAQAELLARRLTQPSQTTRRETSLEPQPAFGGTVQALQLRMWHCAATLAPEPQEAPLPEVPQVSEGGSPLAAIETEARRRADFWRGFFQSAEEFCFLDFPEIGHAAAAR